MNKLFDVAISFAMENQDLAEKVYHYLKAEGLSVFYAPAPECQSTLSGKNQREVFYRIFGLESDYAILLVSKFYVSKKVPMEEAKIAFSKLGSAGKVIPIYLDKTPLPKEMLNPQEFNYFPSNDAVEIAAHVADKINKANSVFEETKGPSDVVNKMNNKNNKAETQIFIQNYNGN